MGRKKTSSGFAYFQHNLEDNTNKCLVEDYESKIRSNHAGNLKSHLRGSHAQIYKIVAEKDESNLAKKMKLSLPEFEEISSTKMRQKKLDENFVQRVPKSIKINMDVETALRGCLELVTKDGRPFAVVEDSGFQTLVSPLLGALNLPMNRRKIAEIVMEEFQKQKKILISQLAKKLIFLKIDIDTRMDRQFLGINVQFFDGERMCLKTLAVAEIKEGSTKSEVIKSILEETLVEFQVAPAHVLSITSDNGSNMIKTVRLMDESVQAEADLDIEYGLLEDTELEVDHERLDEQSNDNEESVGSDDEINEEQMQSPSHFAVEGPEVIRIPNIVSTRCAAHTLELAVRDALQLAGIKRNLHRVRNVVKKMRTPTLIPIVLKRYSKKPILDTSVRWGSSYDMVDVFLSMRDIVNEWGATNASFKITEASWGSIQSIKDVLMPIRKATLELQSENLTPGGFLKIWTKAKLELQKITASDFANFLLERMVFREKQLFDENPLMLAGVFLDPRYSVYLTTEQKKIAKEAIMSIANRMNELVIQEAPADENLESSESKSDDAMEEFLKATEKTRDPAIITPASSALVEAVNTYEKLPRQTSKGESKFDLFDWWSANGPEALRLVAKGRYTQCSPLP